MITVDNAIKQGHKMVNYPILIFMSGTTVICFYLDKNKLSPEWMFPFGLTLSFILSWLYWSFVITKWRLWAFKHVDDPYALKRRAIQEKLIWKDGSVFEKTEIRTKAQEEEWKAIQKSRFNKDES